MTNVQGKHVRMEVKQPWRMPSALYALIVTTLSIAAFCAGYWITGVSGWF